ncbi:tyrosine-type recombinase/integrase [Bacillus amyloliquefaciens]|uniref:tyrosine-type recombinase/integrase n=1 Tax=Bacillus amyloliquefaciens group TaxID=1938374 RepID=UPI001E288809|nr:MULTISPECIES: tyrosine-type recombinase/integrase [Bacillus amyloliquefaciens group]MDE5155555.1 tyrosine-type recombinase/integrase [Bacillus amyloliquefaciens]MEC1566939.1 tyrosine-type recombinase/integrase [Bacillus velezensis]UUI54687.1 tyrosine-type recombinase/integrase [Bacillus velezensis]WIA27834.1 tyrosine-type recombinase/integrase [Bacillus velezensis]
MNPRNLLRQFKAYLKQLDLPDIPFHNLRHSHASLLLTKFHPKVVQERSGHKDIQVTLNTYSHLMPTCKRMLPHLSVVSYKANKKRNHIKL